MDFYIRNKVITLDKSSLPEEGLIQNNFYTVTFHFDDEWFERQKTARFITGDKYVDIVIANDTCTFPYDAMGPITQIGVFSGKLRTTTSAYVSFAPSILSKQGFPADPTPDVYNQVMDRIKGYEEIIRSVTAPDYIVNVENDDSGGFSADKSSFDVEEAYLRGDRCFLKYGSTVYTLLSSDGIKAVFTAKYCENNTLIVNTFELVADIVRHSTVTLEKQENVLVDKIKLLGLGDSICSGNSGKGFVGNLGLPYVNVGISGARLSNGENLDSNGIQRVDIPGQLDNFNLLNADYYPDAIIADGGVNDYMNHVPLGTMSTMPAYSVAQGEALDRSTVIGALEYLFYRMVNLYPKAQRFFLMVHKMYGYHKGFNKWYYFPEAKNQAGYNMNDMYNAVAACCKLYNVKLIDVYNEGAINTRFIPYRSEGNTLVNPNDGIHPLAEGYEKMYKPVVKMALGYASVK